MQYQLEKCKRSQLARPLVSRALVQGRPHKLSSGILKPVKSVKTSCNALTDTAAVRDYIKTNPTLAKTLVGGDIEKVDSLKVEEICDGKINYVFKVQGDKQPLILKYAPPYVKVDGEDVKLSQERLRIESGALTLAREVCPEHTPALFLYDDAASVLVTQCLGLPLVRLSQGIAEKRVYHKFAEQISNLLSKNFFFTSRYFLEPKAFRERCAAFENKEAVAANLAVVLDHPFDPEEKSNSIAPLEDILVDRIRSDHRVLDAVKHLRDLYTRRKEAIVHNDLHANNLFVSADQLYLIDWEFAASGPFAFDLGSLVGNLFLAACCIPPPAPTDKAAVDGKTVATSAAATAAAAGVTRDSREREWLLHTVDKILRGVFERIRDLESTLGCAGEPLPEDFEERLLLDSAGFAACAIFRQVVGRHRFAPLASIVDPAVRRAAERRCLRAAFTLFRVCDSGIGGRGARRRQVLLFPGSDGSKAGGLSFAMDPAVQDQILMI